MSASMCRRPKLNAQSASIMMEVILAIVSQDMIRLVNNVLI